MYPIRKVVTLQDACFADYHCNHLPNALCTLDMEMPKYNMSCQCIPDINHSNLIQELD